MNSLADETCRGTGPGTNSTCEARLSRSGESFNLWLRSLKQTLPTPGELWLFERGYAPRPDQFSPW